MRTGRAKSMMEAYRSIDTARGTPMCRRVTCRTCEKPTWMGCGDHVEEALAGVPQADRCQCRD